MPAASIAKCRGRIRIADRSPDRCRPGLLSSIFAAARIPARLGHLDGGRGKRGEPRPPVPLNRARSPAVPRFGGRLAQVNGVVRQLGATCLASAANRVLPSPKMVARGSRSQGRQRLCGWCGAVAQMGERCNRTAEVRGSIPLSSTSRSERDAQAFTALGRSRRCSITPPLSALPLQARAISRTTARYPAWSEKVLRTASARQSSARASFPVRSTSG